MTDARPAYLIHTWGCQMNDDDSQQMSNLLEQMGYRRANDEADADVILLNTCSVREKPEQKAKSKLGELRALKEAKPGLVVGVCGCMAQREGKAFLRISPVVDLVIGTAQVYELPALIEQARAAAKRIVSTDIPMSRNGAAHMPRVVENVGLKTFVPIMYGCDNYCTYCVVPSARGPERSRSADEIVAEVRELVARGCREVTLIGQNVNSYRGAVSGQQSAAGYADYAELLAMVDAVTGLERIRFTTSHPKDLSDRLIATMANLPTVCEHLHLPMQAGDNEVLDRMGRGYTIQHYMSLVEKLRTRIPGIAITTDVMVGFPGETDEQFHNTLDAVRDIRFDGAFMFAFNPRPGTPAAEMDGQIEHSVKTRRLIELIAVQNDITLEINESYAGDIFEVLVEGPSDKDRKKLTGYTRTHRTVNFEGPARVIGRLANVRAVKAHPWGFTGELVTSASP